MLNSILKTIIFPSTVDINDTIPATFYFVATNLSNSIDILMFNSELHPMSGFYNNAKNLYVPYG